ncbi:hypothetical protein [Pseudomonas sp. DTU12.3]|uniref:hypothetical protein n=1 Tax=Pseudomonas sp. DTU12.3 TaxID=2073078 RepID=UPI002115A84C|nr:hypothetical protein [Pseudomonas sp. DTU12.3]
MANKTDAQVVAVLMAIGFNERDGRWAQNACLVLCESEQETIVACASPPPANSMNWKSTPCYPHCAA